MDFAPLLKAIRDYGGWELTGAAGAAFFKLLRGPAPATKDVEKASREGSLSLTPDGWVVEKRQFESSSPIKPR